ncbi:TRAP transporter large permease [Brachybacterium sacelli]|uniref:Tripartite ATP-independent transporter DctM subunit n=1 Tax=Brachybacterium sacelli TaxID=173364 RepID=A0ABS4WZ94_9MICO|nr:TRAP transporter large permease [Brachybacterium sacelli]MBP2381532.1 tripartite ATP-independent transporter DctM subunit [Brachybacterium sacelli]
MIIGLVILFLIIVLLLGLPIGLAFALAALVGVVFTDLPLASLGGTAYPAVATIPLLAIPFFILAGEMMNRGRLIDRLVDLADRALFWLPERIGHVTVVASAFLGAMTGSSVATVAAVGTAVGKRMTRMGYKKGYVGALTASSGLLGVLIPPSIPLIVYGAAVGVSVSDLFLATIIPGIVMVIAFMAVHAITGPRAQVATASSGSVGESSPRLREAAGDALRGFPRTLWRSLPALALPVVILGGIYSGLTTATEAAAVAGLYALIVILVGRMVTPGQVPSIFYKSALSAGAILVIIAFTAAFNRLVTLMRVPQSLAESVTDFTSSPMVFLILVNILLFLVGMFMETNAAVLLMAPLLFPSAMSLGIDPVHFGIILVTNIEIGLITPPLAANVFVAARTTDIPLPQMLPYIWRFLVAAIAVLLLITYVPALSLWWQ